MVKKNATSNNVYYSIVVDEKNRSHFGIYHQNPAEGLTEIKTKDKDGNVKSVKYYDCYAEIQGKLKTVLIYDKEFGQNQKLEMLSVYVALNKDVNEVVTVPFESRFAQSFIKCIESVNPEKEVMLKVFSIKNDDKSAAKGKDIFNDYFCIYQQNEDGKWETVKSKYKFIPSPDDEKVNANMNVLPPFEKKEITKKGKTITEYDTSKFNEALREIVARVNPEFKTAYEASIKVADAQKTQEEVDNEKSVNDDLPF